MIHFWNFCRPLTGLVLSMALSVSAFPQGHKSDYTFKIKERPVGLAPCGEVVAFTYGDNKVFTLRSHELSKFDGNILDISFNPAGIGYAVVSDTKKHAEAKVLDPASYNHEIYKFNVKKYGVPSAAVYSPDARKLLLATDRGVLVMDSRSYAVSDTLQIPFTPRDLAVSNNMYYLLASDDNQVAVYNLEEKTLRKKWKFDEKVNKAGFSDDSSELAILTDDGMMSVYDTRTFLIKKNIESLGEGLSFAYNPDGKYVAVATAPNVISIVNMLDESDRELLENPDGGTSSLVFLVNSSNQPMLAYNTTEAVKVKRLASLVPYYNKLIADGAEEMMNEWLKMMPGETMEQYRERVNAESRAKQRRLFEDEIATGLAGDLVSMSKITLGKYDRANQLLSVAFDNMPSIFLPVPENSVTAFKNADDLSVSDAKYGIMPNDNFELIYAKFYNKANGETYIYDNLDRVPLNFMESDDNMVSLEILQQQQMEELRLQELKKKVVEEAKLRNVISDHTNITVDSRIETAYDANGEKILNYKVKFSYEVEPEFSVQEDFGPGKYHVDESGAARSMLSLVKQALEGDFSQYVTKGKKLVVNISGAADATPIRSKIMYDGVYGDFENEPVRQNGRLSAISVNQKEAIQQNEQLAFLRAYGVKDYLDRNVAGLRDMNKEYNYNISVSEGKGSEFRRIIAEFTFVDAF